MYCKNCKHQVSLEDNYCPYCSELLTEFTTTSDINEKEEFKNPHQQKISKKGKRLIGIGLLLILVQLFNYSTSTSHPINLNGISETMRTLGYNAFIISGVIFLVVGLQKVENK